MKLKNNILDDSDYSDYSDDGTGLEINEPIDNNIINCQEETVDHNDNQILIASNVILNEESNARENIMTNLVVNNTCISQDSSMHKSPLIETLRRRELELGTIIGQIRTDLSEHIKNEDEYNIVGLTIFQFNSHSKIIYYSFFKYIFIENSTIRK